jgi:MOSC domain-containing protein YiiM
MRHLNTSELEAGLEHICNAPKDNGMVELIVRRPQIDEREVLTEAQLDLANGLVGDNWHTRGSRRTDDGSAHPDMQLNVMNARVIALIAQTKENWSLAGDQLYLDLDISAENLPVGSHLMIGSAVIEVTPPPHTGCHKFVSRFGLEAMKFVNSELGRELRLRGLNAKVVQPGVIRVGDQARKI